MNIPSDEDLQRILTRVSSWPSILRSSMVTIHSMEGPGGDPMYAVAVHNPFDLRQYQVLALLPGLELDMAVTKVVGESLDQIEHDVDDAVDFQETLEAMKRNRLYEASENDPDFAHRVVDAKFQGMELDEVGALYQEHYGLRGGGDFNRPLY